MSKPRICVFCASSPGKSPTLSSMATDLGEKLAKANMNLAYGGAKIGLMGAVATGHLNEGGDVLGVMPTRLIEWEVAHEGLSEFIETDTMHERKEVLYKRSNAFVALPGGAGTLDELCEIWTWAQLKYHQRPIFLVNWNGFYDAWIAHIQRTVDEGLLSAEHQALVRVVKNNEELIKALENLKLQ